MYGAATVSKMERTITADFIRTRIRHLRHCAQVYKTRGDSRNRALAVASAVWWRKYLRTAI